MTVRFTSFSVNPIIHYFLPTLFLLLAFFIPLVSFAQPANDDCMNATAVVDLNGGCNVYSYTGATTDLLNGSCVAQGVNALNTWFQFTAVATDLTVLSTVQNGNPMEITIIEFNPTNCDFNSATQLACSASPLNAPGILTPGNTYYIVITDPNGMSTPGYNLCVTNQIPNPPPPNDDPCAAQVVQADGSCNNGSTVNATIDWTNGDPNCNGLDENSVWYTTTLGPNMNELQVQVQGYNGNLMVMVGTFAGANCNGTFQIDDYFCGNSGGLPLNVTGLTENTQYWVQISTSTASEGTFNVCLTENGPPPGCSNNDFCNQAEVIPTPVTGNACNPIPGCNIGANPEPGLAGSCNFATEEVVWFTFTSDNTAGLFSASVVSNEITQPSIQLFSGGCNGLVPVSNCATGSNGTVTLVNESVSPNTNYWIAVSNAFGTGGHFDLCIATFADLSSCVTESSLYVAPGSPSFGSPDNGPYQPGETVTFCFDLINYQADPVGVGNNCQWLQGIVPVFGDCWDSNAFDPTASMPPSLYGATWDWYTNSITYNNTNPNITIADCDGDGITDVCHITEPTCCNVGTTAGAILPPGWFAGQNGGNPNNVYGDGNCCNCNMGPWSFCFDVTTKLYPECDQSPSYTDCTVKIYTFADGETGSWNGGASTCAQDVPQINTATMNCCEGATVDYQEGFVCSGDAVFLQLTSNQDPDVDFSWTVNPPDNPPNPNAYGALSGSGSFINQTLTNNTGAPVTIYYSVSGSNNQSGCIGLPTDIPVTIYSDIEVNIPPVLPVCAGECTDIEAFATGGSGVYVNYEWGQGLPSGAALVNVCPSTSTIYTVTVTDNLGCTGEGTVTVDANSNLVISITANPDTETCQDFNNPATVTATVDAGGSGSYTYQWSSILNGLGGSAPTEVVFDTDTYCVEITDLVTNCTGTQCIDMIINPLPLVLIVDPPQICESDLQYCFDAIPDDGTGIWGGVADVNGCIDPSALGVGLHQVTFEYTDLNGCYDIAIYDFLIDPLPASPQALNDVNLCAGIPPQTYTVNAVPGAFTYTWTIPADATITAGQGTNSVTIDWTGSSGGQVCVTADNDCGSSPQSCFNATVGNGPVDPSPPQDITFCSNIPMQNFSITAVPGASSYTWTVPAGVSITAGQTTTDISVDWGNAASGQVCVTASNACGSSNQICATASVETVPASPTPPTDASICAGTTNDSYSITAVPTATGYTWTIPAGANITAGQNTNSITVDWGNASDGQVCVTADNNCGASAPACFEVSIENIPSAPTPPANSNACAGDTNVNYSISSVANASSYTWTVPAGATIANGQGATSINVDWGNASSGQICVSAENNCGASPQACFDVTIDMTPNAPNPPTDVSICAGAQGETYSINTVTGATSYTWTVPGSASIVNGQGTTDIEIDWANNATSGQICVSADNNCGMSTLACFNVNVEDVPPAATPPSDAVICEGTQSDSYSVNAVPGATTYTWTVPNNATITNGQGTTDIEIDWGNATSGQVCVTTSNNCGDGPQACFNVTIDNLPQTPVPPANNNACEGATNINYAIAPVANASSYTWTVPAGASITNGQGTTSINVDWGNASSGQICVSAENNCGASPQACFDVTIDMTPNAPNPPTDVSICAGAQGETYSINTVTGATSYTWTVPGSASIVNGQGTTDIEIDWANNATSGQICVSADNNCGMSTPACFNVNVEDVPAAATPPSDAVICEGTQNDSYSVNAVPGATTYTWTVPNNATITNGQGTTDIEIDWGNATSGQVCVTTSNNCGDGPQACFNVTIDNIPQAPIPPANTLACQGDLEVYTINDVPGATSYTWTVPNGANITLGQGSNSINIDWGLAVSGQVCVSSNNNCGSSTAACFDVDIIEAPVAPTPPADVSICASSQGETYSIAAVTGADTYTWTVQGSGATIIAGQGTTNIEIDYGNAGQVDICVQAENNCAVSPMACFTATINPIPDATFSVLSPLCSDASSTITYLGSASPTATYDWNFNGGSITNGGSGAGPYEVNWNAAGIYTVSLTVTENNCVSVPVIMQVEVEAPLSLPVINCNTTTNSVEFTWNDVPGATGYLVNGQAVAGTSYTESGLNSGDVVTITLTALSNGPCGNSEATQTCSAQDCPPVQITIDPVADICLNNTTTTVSLVASVSGGNGGGTGMWSGTGITDAQNGIFDPIDASTIIGINTLSYTYTEGNCTYTQSVDVIVNNQPAADFSVPSPICAEDTISISYTGNASASATFDWDFGNTDFISGTGAGPYLIHFPDGSNANISLTVTSMSGCPSEQNSQSITVDEPLAVPNIICNTTTDNIEFSWDAVPGAVEYLVNGIVQASTTYNATGLNAGDMVTVTVVAVGNGSCGNSQATQTCTADDCPPVQINIDPISDICLDASAAPFILSANIVGGMGNGVGQWQGPGIVDAALGTFDPNAATVSFGVNTITYFYQEGTCDYSQTIDIIVNEQPTANFTVQSPICAGDVSLVTFEGNYNTVANYTWDFGNGTVINTLGQESYEVQFPVNGTQNVSLQVELNGCASELNTESIQVDALLPDPLIICNSTTTSIEFSWDAIPGANGYLVNGTPQGGTTYNVTGLSTGDMITIEVVAIGTGACGNSMATQTCTAEDCPPIQVTIDPVSDFCQDALSIPVTLNATVVGGTNGTGLWSGNGIIDPNTGTFDPNAAGVVIGTNTITYTYSEPPCSYTATIDIVVNAVPSATFSIDDNLCVGDEVSVSYLGNYSGTATYNWDFGAGILLGDLGQENYTIQFPTAGNHNISLSVQSNGCSSETEMQSIQVEAPLPEPNIVCEPTLTSVNFMWDAIPGVTEYIVNGISQQATNFEFTGLTAGDIVNITVVAVNNGLCGNTMASAQCEASDCPPIALSLTPIDDICKSDMPSGNLDLEVMITGGTGNGTGQWSGAGIIDANTGLFNPDDPSLMNGANTVTFNYEEDGCSFSESITINVYDQPSINIDNPETLSCANNQMVTLNGSGSGSPTWTGPDIQSGANTYTPVVAASGLYTLVVTDPVSGCTNSESIMVNADNSVPMADAGEDGVLDCNNDASLTLIAGGTLGPDYEVTWSGPAITATNMNEETPTVDQPGVYILTIENTVLNCISEPDTVNITMDVLPPNAVIQFTGSLDCFNTSVLLTADVDPAHDWYWVDPEGNNSTEQTIEATLGGTYILFVLDPQNGCTNTDTASIDDLTAYPLVVAGSNQELDCANPVVTLDGSGSQVGPTIVYQWQGPAGGIIGSSAESIVQATLPGMYILTAEDLSNNCMNSDTVFVTEDMNAPQAEAGVPLSFGCSDETVALSGAASTGADTYLWEDASGTILSNSVNVDVTDPGLYYLTAINSDNDCSDVDSVLVSPPTNMPYDVVAEISAPSCFGDSDGFIIVNEVLGGTAPYSYSSDGITFESFPLFSSLSGDTTYAISIVDAEGCTFETEIFVPQPAALDIAFNPDLTIDLGEVTNLNPTYSIDEGAIDTVIWSPIEALVCDDIPCLYPSTNSMMYYTTTITATLIDTFGCATEKDITIVVKKDRPVYIPNAFSPNGDGINELFMIEAGLQGGITRVNFFRIFNRWGEMVFEAEGFQASDPRFGWDGRLNGKKLNPGVYVYVAEIEFIDGFKILYKGDVTLME